MAVPPISTDDYDPNFPRSNGLGDADPRRPWSTPIVIVSEMRHSGAHVALGSDGTDSDVAHYQYGS